jgi:hypothetical protein
MRILLRLISFVLVSFLAFSNFAYGHSHLETGYVPWGIDEFQFFGLNKAELSKQFKGQLTFDQKFTNAKFNSDCHHGPQFLLTFKNDRVSTVQRMFIDGAGCEIKGPEFMSKKDALKFSILGLSKRTSRDLKDDKMLATAKQMLAEIEKSEKTTTKP